MPFLPFGEKVFLQELKCVVSHFIICNHQAFPSDSSKQPVPELHAHNITYTYSQKLIYLLRESRICHNKYFMDSTKVTGKSENFEYFGHVEPRRQPLGKEQRALHYTVNGLSRTSSFRLD
jgi:hypothetical protein